MNSMVLGFAFDSYGRVALIRKNRPDWQRGKLNGIGGHVESDESVRVAMSREFSEETGVLIPADEWTLRGQMFKVDHWIVHVFTVRSAKVADARTSTDEHVNLYMLTQMFEWRHHCIANVPALIELCRIPPEPPSDAVPAFALRY